ncbi:peptidase M16C associated-domain-containing protein [Blastocladiella britannica]|nr:peptidase M16C associated-domain-containing protein [Blastocladiella britannica]
MLRLACRTRSLRTPTRAFASLPATGDVVHGFRVARTTHVPELQMTVSELNHSASGAKYTHFSRNDANNVFAVGFRTPVADSTGVPHILEHTTLCGSEKYPVRDPFFKMLQRSLATYMNAWTASDFTVYPFSTQNLSDYNNLMSVYMDAVFRPNLKQQDFMQEGWRLEHRDPQDTSTPIEFKGVVYNEMKGAMSSIHSHFSQTLHSHLFADSIYAPNSGGDPRNITDLTWEKLTAYHRAHYAPQNAQFLSYGNFDLGPTLQYVDRTLSSIPTGKPLDASAIADLPVLREPKVVKATCMLDPMGDPAKQTRFCLAFGCNDTAADSFTTTALAILSKLLLDGSSSPMQKALIDSGLAPDYAPVHGYDTWTRRGSFTIGVQGVAAAAAPEIEETIWRVLRDVAANGFPADRVAAVIHQSELSLRHVTGAFGMSLIENLAPGLFHGVDTAHAVQVAAVLQKLREEAPRGLFQRLVQQYLLDNPHRVALTMEPEPEFGAVAVAEETARLEAHVAKLTDQDRKRIARLGVELAAAQDAKQDVSILPCLGLSDVPSASAGTPSKSAAPVASAAEGWGEVFVRKAPANGVTYIRAMANLEGISSDLLPYLPLYSSALSWQGTKEKSMEVLDQELRLYTGGVGHGSSIASSIHDGVDRQLSFAVSGNSLSSNVPRLTQLMSELTFSSNFALVDRLNTLLAGNLSGMTNAIVGRGHSYAMGLAASKLSPIKAVSESWSGLSQLQFLTQLQKSGVETAVPKLEAIAKHLSQAPAKYMIVAQPEAVDAALEHLPTVARGFGNASPKAAAATPISGAPPTTLEEPSRVYVPSPFPVNFCAAAYATVPFTNHRDSMALTVASRLATLKFLHREVREKGGAYGGGASHDGREGVFVMYSYRDPRSLGTIADFDRAVAWLASGDGVADQDLLEAKLSVFGQLDEPVDVGAQGTAEFAHGLAYAVRQERRKHLFDVTRDDVARVAQTYLHGQVVSRVILGGADGAKEVEKEGWSVMPLEV